MTESPIDKICREAKEHQDYVLAHPEDFSSEYVAEMRRAEWTEKRLSIAATLRYDD